MLIRHLPLLILCSSCALFQGQSSLKEKKAEDLLDAVKVTGEGRGRLTFGNKQYVFSVDAILNEKSDWILAVSIPLQGEEVMILPDLKSKSVENEEVDSFESRIENEFKALKLNQTMNSEDFLKELRSFIRFILAKKLNLERSCRSRQEIVVCKIEDEDFALEASDKELLIKKILGNKKSLAVVAKNLTESFFSKTDIRLLDKGQSKAKNEVVFSLELFW